ncbi:LD-carboxypeptidase [Umezawaea endophytica]|uniref:LD-carboxypeptidase n=1 Tax=Umezawaea endophytica TaxID=1654476 RepID=A0A9X3AGT4_9PSEU|nr:LD-carboxypeptidase [Umezawaea endophytica]MCS7480527.1 LD-carboxypeptidase [Umezawaea endophytica]
MTHPRHRPPPLQPGDRVTVIAPAAPVHPGLLTAGTAILRTWGLDVHTAPHVHDVHPTLPYLAGHDTHRAQDLTDAWHDPDVKAVITARGGYGSQRLLDHVDWTSLHQTKHFTGSSDTTALHSALTTQGIPTHFAPMIATTAFVHDTQTQENLRRSLFDPPTVLTGPHTTTLTPGTARGTTTGGTLTLIDPTTPRGGIVLLEDIDEDTYRLDRMLTALLRTGWFDTTTGIALGSWHHCGPTEHVLHDRLTPLGIPVLADLGFGHCPGQLTIPLGVEVELDADRGTLTVLETPAPAVPQSSP